MDCGLPFDTAFKNSSFGPEEKDIPLLIRALADKQRNVRIQAARGLGNLGLPSKDAIGALRN